jgi:hypothetical protein
MALPPRAMTKVILLAQRGAQDLRDDGHAPWHFYLRDCKLASVIGPYVVTTMWTIFGGIWRTLIRCGIRDLAYLCTISGQSGMPRHMCQRTRKRLGQRFESARRLS